MELHGQRVLVIGGRRGIGAAIAGRARDEGAEVLIASRDGRDTDVLIDLTEEDTIAAAATQLGGVDHVVTTGSLPHDVPVHELDHDLTVRAFEAKVIGPLMVAKHLKIRQSLTLLSGVIGWKPGPRSTVKGITNGSVAFAARHLATNLAPVRVNAIAPGVIDSGMWDDRPEGKDAFLQAAGAQTLVGRHGTVDDIADAATWLLGAGFVTGETIHVDGGWR